MPTAALRKYAIQCLRWFAFWTVIALLFSIRTAGMEQSFHWKDSFLGSAAQWYVWALLAFPVMRVDRLLPVNRDALVLRFLFHVPLSLAFTVAYLYLNAAALDLLSGAFTHVPAMGGMLLGGIYWNIPVYWVIVGVYVAFDYQKHLKDRQVKTVELERLLSESRLETLRAQLHPHFLFNALNAVSAYVERDPRAARRMLEQLGELLRLSLDHSEDPEIPLERELAFLERYFGLQKIRFEDRLRVNMNIDPHTPAVLVPTFILQPLVENAIRHGISARPGLGLIEVSAWLEHGTLRLRVRDDGPGLPAGWSLEATAGVGLSNTRERLRHLYGDRQKFEITAAEGGGVKADITLPARLSAIPSPGASFAHEHAASTRG
jgi:two-component system LytT family sensor kinase